MTFGDSVALVLAAGLLGVIAGVFLARWRFARTDGAVASRAAPEPQERDARFDQLMRSISLGVITLDERGQIRAVNAAANTMFNLGNRPMVGRALIEAVPSFDLDRRVRDALVGRPSRGAVDLSVGVAEPRTLMVTAVPVDGAQGAILVAADETRLLELENTRREFVSSVSHELRTPLSSIKLMIETLLSRPDDAEARTLFLPRVEHEVERMVQLVEDLLEVARSESGRLQLRRGHHDLSTVAAATVKNFEQRAARLDVSLAFEGEPTMIDGDPARLAQVVVNLVDNALRHTPAGGSISVAVTPRDHEAVLLVRDTGEGIPYRDLPHVFERFYVVDRSRAREAGGTGLGLAIVKQIVEAHGGTVSAESELGTGSTFLCAFPAGPSADAGDGVSEASKAPDSESLRKP